MVQPARDVNTAPAWRDNWMASMRVRIVAVVVFLLVLSSVGSIALLRTVLFARLDEGIQVSLEREAEEFRKLTAGVDPRTGQPFGTDVRAMFDVYFSREVPDEGETLLTFVDGELYQTLRARDAADPEELQEAIDYWLTLEEEESGVLTTPAGEARYIAIPYEGDPKPGLFVVANFPAYERDEIDDAVQSQIAVQAIALLLASALGLALAGRVLRPLRSLATTAGRITDTDLSQRIPVSGNDEASQIAVTFNDMLERLEQAFRAQRLFLDDTSHELRTPLTVIRGHLELLELDEDPEERRQTIELVTDEIDRMNEIVNDLFLLARSEQPDFLSTEQIDLRSLVASVHLKVSVLAPRDWQLADVPSVPLTVDRNRLTQALLQLADNAVRHTQEGDRIGVGARVQDGRAILWVDDQGSGVPSEVAERIFERFQRGPVGASGATGGGLGLAIVAAIAEAHGGQAALVPRPGPGARFEITVPL